MQSFQLLQVVFKVPMARGRSTDAQEELTKHHKKIEQIEHNSKEIDWNSHRWVISLFIHLSVIAISLVTEVPHECTGQKIRRDSSRSSEMQGAERSGAGVLLEGNERRAGAQSPQNKSTGRPLGSLQMLLPHQKSTCLHCHLPTIECICWLDSVPITLFLSLSNFSTSSYCV